MSADSPFPGVRRSTHQTALTTIASYDFEPGAEFPLHSHPEEQIVVVIEGEVTFTVEGSPHRLGAGESYAVASGLTHGLRAGDAGARFVAVVTPRRTDPNAYEIAEQETPK